MRLRERLSRHRTITGDLLLGLLSVVIPIMLLRGTIEYRHLTSNMRSALEKHADASADDIATILQGPLFVMNNDEVRRIATLYVDSGRLAGIRIVSEASGPLVERPSAEPSVITPRERAVRWQGQDLGRVELWFADHDLTVAKSQLVWNLALLSSGVLLVGFSIFYISMQLLLTKPLAGLLRRIREMASGNLLGDLAPVPQQDLNLIISAMNTMSRDLVAATSHLRESNARYQTLVNNIPLGINLIDNNYQIVMSNATMGRWFAKEQELFSGRHCYREFEKREHPCAHCPGTVSMTTGALAMAETEGVRDDGSRFTARISTVPLGGPGAVSGFIEVVEDITVLKKAKETAQAAQERIQRQHAVLATIAVSHELVSGDIHELAVQIDELAAKALDVARVGVWLFNGTGDELRCIDLYENAADRHSADTVLQQHEYANEFESLKGAKYVDAHEPLTDPRTAGYVENYLKPLHITSMLDAVIRESGRNLGVICFEHVDQAHHWEADEIAFACQLADQLAIALINHERKLAAEALGESELRYRTMINSARDVVFVIDQERRILSLNPAFETTTGLSIPEWLGRSFEELLHPDDVPHARQRMQAVLNEEHAGCHEYRIRTTHGGYAIVEIQGFPLIENGALTGLVGFARDVTESKRLEQQLNQSQKMESIGTLAGGIAHDFNNILSAVIGFTDLALMKVEGETPLRNDLLEVRHAGERATSLVKQILTFSRKQQQEKLPLQISLVIKEALKFLRASIPSTIDIRQDITAQGTALADPTQIHQVIMNLCTNAYHAMLERGGVLGVTLKEITIERTMIDCGAELPPGQYLRLSVSDSGCGMDKATMARIFEPYFTTKEQGRGTGLGLATVHGIVKDHQGRIDVYSEPGYGTTFNVYLPMISQMQPMEQQPVELPPMARAHERIMVVDDEEAIRDMTRQFLTQAGYQVDLFTNGVEAWAAFRQTPDAWRLLLTDQTMPGMTGGQLAAKARELRPGLPVIICSGFSEILDDARVHDLGIKAYLQKPMGVSPLLIAVAKALYGEAA